MSDQKKIEVIFDRGHAPDVIATPLLRVADAIAGGLAAGFDTARAAAKGDQRIGEQVCQLIAATPQGQFLHQFNADLAHVPDGSLCALIFAPEALPHGRRLWQVNQMHLMAINLEDVYPRARVTGALYLWILAGNCHCLYDSLTLKELREVRDVLRSAGCPLPHLERFLQRVKAETKLAIITARQKGGRRS